VLWALGLGTNLGSCPVVEFLASESGEGLQFLSTKLCPVRANRKLPSFSQPPKNPRRPPRRGRPPPRARAGKPAGKAARKMAEARKTGENAILPHLSMGAPRRQAPFFSEAFPGAARPRAPGAASALWGGPRPARRPKKMAGRSPRGCAFFGEGRFSPFSRD